jgi:N-acetylmuramoyl-L-alanine amidase
MTGRLTVDTASGRVIGPAAITYNKPFPCVNGRYGSGQMAGVLMHTTVSEAPSAVAWFNNPQAQASAHFVIAESGEITQMGPIGKGWEAWHAAEANAAWYGIEHADNGNPANPLTPAQITASAQLVECLSAFAGFPLQISDSPSVRGFGWHGMGGAAFGGHYDCPGDVRKAQRGQIIALAIAIRSGAQAEPVAKPAVPPGQWLDPKTWEWAEVTISGTGLDGKTHSFAYSRTANVWAKVL